MKFGKFVIRTFSPLWWFLTIAISCGILFIFVWLMNVVGSC